MAGEFVFREQDFNNLEFVRQVVLHRLKTEKDWHQFDYSWETRYQRVVVFEPPRLHTRFCVLANEVMWQLIMQGVITPGMDASNPKLPWFRITEYGEKVLSAGKLIPHDPTSYLEELKKAAAGTVGETAIVYVAEALRCYNAGCHIASVLLLGVASEAIFLTLCGKVEGTIRSHEEKAKFSKLGDHIARKHQWIIAKYQSLPSDVRRNQLPESLDITLTSLYDMIRRQRNELGHPRETPPDMSREEAFVLFQLFPNFVTSVHAFTQYIEQNGL